MSCGRTPPACGRGPTRLAFRLQWDAFVAGEAAVGAVVVDGGGAVVSTGRNRRHGASAPPGELAGTSLAHAEVNALVKLPPGEYRDHTLLTTLEPCLLCSAALRMSHVGTVAYAAADPLWTDIDRLPLTNPHIARHWAVRAGRMGGPLEAWATLLAVVRHAAPGGHGAVVAQYRRDLPAVMALAQRLVDEGYVAKLRELSLTEAFEVVGTVAAVSGRRAQDRRPQRTTAGG
ncbi:MAG: deaminase [Micromonosporaceae bacterium]